MANSAQDYEIKDGDFVNQGKSKFNEAVKQLPTGLTLENGILTVVLYKGVALQVDLTDYFPTRTEVADQILPPVGSFSKPGLLQLAHDDSAEDLKSETKPLGAAAVVRLIESYLGEETTVTLASLLTGSTKAQSNAFLLGLLNLVDENTAVQARFCEIMSRCGYTPPTTGTITHRFRNFRHFEFVDSVITPPTLDPSYIIRYDVNNCDEFRGWNVDQNNPNSSPPVRIVRDGVVTATITPTIDRPDVRDYLIQQGKLPAGSTYVKYGYAYPKTQSDRDGNQHTFEAYAGNSTVKATSDSGVPASLICGAPVVIPTNPAPTVANSYVDQVVTKSGDQLLDPITGVFSDTDALTFSATLSNGNPLPAGVSFYPLLAQPFNVSGSFPNQQLPIRIWATDTAGQRVYDEFLLTVNRAVVNPVQLTGQTIGGDTRTIEGSGARVRVYNTFDNGSTNDYTAGGAFSIAMPYPDGMAISTENGVGVITTQETISADVQVTLIFTFPDGRTITGPFTVVDKMVATSPITSYLINNISVIEGGQGTVQVYGVHADGNWSEVTEANGSRFDLIAPYPDGMTISYGNTGRATVQTAGNSITADVQVRVRFTFGGGGTVEGIVTILNQSNPTTTDPTNPTNPPTNNRPYVEKFAVYIPSGTTNAVVNFFLKIANVAAGTEIQITWPEFNTRISSASDRSFASNIDPNPANFPTGYKDYNLINGLFYIPASALQSHSTQHIKVRVKGAADYLLETTFDPFGLSVGQAKQFYPL